MNEEKKAEPFLIKAGDPRLLINSMPPKVDCRVLSEYYYIDMVANNASLTTENKELKGKVDMLVKELKEIHKYLGSHDCTEGTELHYMKQITDLLSACGVNL